MRTAPVLLLLILSACDSGVEQELAKLRAELATQQTEIDYLRAFVDSQAEVLTICQGAVVELTNYLINTNTIGLFREAAAKVERLGKCSDAVERFNTVATTYRMP